MAKDISNAYLVTTAAGDVLINTGFMDNAQRYSRERATALTPLAITARITMLRGTP